LEDLKELRSKYVEMERDILEKEKIIAETLQSGSTAANPKPITRADVEYLLKELF
jgi:alcohol dehydrogenase class IV